jgi:integrase
MRFRRPGGRVANLVLGPVDLSRRAPSGEPEIGQPLTLVAARQLAAKINTERASGRDVVADHKARKHRRHAEIAEAAANSFAAAARDFVEQHAKARTRGWKETARNLGLDYDLEPREGGLADRWSDRSVKLVDAHDLFAAIEEARRFGTPGIEPRRAEPSEARARKLHAALSIMFSWLQQRRRIEVNPMASLHPPGAPKARDRVLTQAEIAKLWVAAGAAAEPFGRVVKLLLLTGARLNEVAQLRWEEVSEDASTITVPGSRTKNHLPFDIFLPPAAREIIGSLPRRDSCPFAFTTNGRTAISGWSKVKRRLDAAMGNVPPWRIHDLRRTAATGMAELGVLPQVVEAALNHVSGHRAGVAGTYNRALYSSEKRAAWERWAAHLASIASGGKR